LVVEDKLVNHKLSTLNRLPIKMGCLTKSQVYLPVGLAVLQPLIKHHSMFKIFDAHTIRTTVKIIAVVVILFVLVNIFS
jgi:hypothetical protein